MKKLISILLAIALLSTTVCLTACGKKEKEPEAPQIEQESFDYSKATAEDLVAHVKDVGNVTVDEYVWLINTYSNVAITEELKLEENITDEAFSLLREEGASFPSLKSSMEELINSDSPQVRGYSYSMMSSIFGVADSEVELAVKELENETEPYVLNNAIKALANSGSNEGVGKFLISMSESENTIIRRSAASALANSWSKDIPDVVNIVTALMDDSDIEVQKNACGGIGKLADDSVVDSLVKILNDNSRADVHSACVKSLVTLWFDFPFYENTSEKAYKATLDYWKKTPRTDSIPAWDSIGHIGTVDLDSDSFKEWKQKATYYKPDEIAEVMTDIILDSDMNWLGRTSAINVIKVHCGKDKLKKLQKKVDALDDDYASFVKDELKKAIEE